jgi:hypothetical protein
MIEDLFGKVIYVFETNLDGTHTSEQAKHAARFYDAKQGVSNGRTGNAYAISTKGYDYKPLPIHELSVYVYQFLYYAKANKDLIFEINMFKDYTEDVVKRLFVDATDNCMMPTKW